MSDALDWMHVSEIVEGRINVKILSTGKKAIVLRKGATIRVYAESCPHLGADLSEARYCPSEGTLQCRWHGYVFASETGDMIENPNTSMMTELRKKSRCFDPSAGPRYRLVALPHEVRGDRVFIGGRGA